MPNPNPPAKTASEIVADHEIWGSGLRAELNDISPNFVTPVTAAGAPVPAVVPSQFELLFKQVTSKQSLESQFDPAAKLFSELFNKDVLNYTAEEEKQVLKKLDKAIEQIKQNIDSHFNNQIAAIDTAINNKAPTLEEKKALEKLKEKLEERRQKTKEGVEAYQQYTKKIAEDELKRRGRQGEMYRESFDFLVDITKGGYHRAREAPKKKRDMTISLKQLDPDLQKTEDYIPAIQSGEYYLTSTFFDGRGAIREWVAGLFFNEHETKPGYTAMKLTIGADGHVTVTGPNYKRWGLNYPLAVVLTGGMLASPIALPVAALLLIPGPGWALIVGGIAAGLLVSAAIWGGIHLRDRYFGGRESMYRKMVKVGIAAGKGFDVAKVFKDYEYPEVALRVAIEEGIELVEPIPAEYQDLVNEIKAEVMRTPNLVDKIRRKIDRTPTGAAKSLQNYKGLAEDVTHFRQLASLMVTLSEGDNQLLQGAADPSIVNAINTQLAALRAIQGLTGNVPGNLPPGASNQDVQHMLADLEQFVGRNGAELSKTDQGKSVVNKLYTTLDELHRDWFGEPRNVAAADKDDCFRKMKPWQQQRRLQVMGLAAKKAGASPADRDTYNKHLELACENPTAAGFNANKFIDLLKENENAAQTLGAPHDVQIREINAEVLAKLYSHTPAHASWNEVLKEVLTNQNGIPQEVRQQFYQHIASDETRFNAALKEIARLPDPAVAPVVPPGPRSRTQVETQMRDYLRNDPRRFAELKEEVRNDPFFTKDWTVADLNAALNNTYGAPPIAYSAEAKASLICSKYPNSPIKQLQALRQLPVVPPATLSAEIGAVYSGLSEPARNLFSQYTRLCTEMRKGPGAPPAGADQDKINEIFQSLSVDERSLLIEAVRGNPEIPQRNALSAEQLNRLQAWSLEYLLSPEATGPRVPPPSGHPSSHGMFAPAIGTFELADPPAHGKVLWKILTDPKLNPPDPNFAENRTAAVTEAQTILNAKPIPPGWTAGSIEIEILDILHSGLSDVRILEDSAKTLENRMIKETFDNENYPTAQEKVERLRDILSQEPVGGQHSNLGIRVKPLLDGGNYSDIITACRDVIDLATPAAFTR